MLLIDQHLRQYQYILDNIFSHAIIGPALITVLGETKIHSILNRFVQGNSLTISLTFSPHSSFTLSVSGLLWVNHSPLLPCRPQENFKAQQYIQLSVYRKVQAQFLQLPGLFHSTRQWTLWTLREQRVSGLLLRQLPLFPVFLWQRLSTKCHR